MGYNNPAWTSQALPGSGPSKKYEEFNNALIKELAVVDVSSGRYSIFKLAQATTAINFFAEVMLYRLLYCQLILINREPKSSLLLKAAIVL